MELVKEKIEAQMIEQTLKATIKAELKLPPKELDGTAIPSRVFKGDTFYSIDAETKETGTYEEPVLSGDATPSDVIKGKTFYKDNVNEKLIGELEVSELDGYEDFLRGYDKMADIMLKAGILEENYIESELLETKSLVIALGEGGIV